MGDEVILEKAEQIEEALSGSPYPAFSGGKQTYVQTN